VRREQFDARIHDDDLARRGLYERLLGTRAQWRVLIRPDRDGEFLLGLATARVPVPDHVVCDLAWAHAATPDDAVRTEIAGYLEESHGTWLRERAAAIERGHDAHRQSVETRRAQDEARSASMRPLAAVVEEILRAPNLEATKLVRSLGETCFAGPGWRPWHIEGVFEHLSPELQRQVFARLRNAFAHAEPMKLPSGNEIPRNVLWEAAAFEALLEWDRGDGWLGAAAIARWLPTALFAPTEGRTELIERCYRVDPDATVAVVIAAMRHEATAGRYGFVASFLPSDIYRRAEVVDAIIEVVRDASLPVEARAPLLRLLGKNAVAQRALPSARELAMGADAIAHVALDVWMTLEPTAAIKEVATRIRSAAPRDRIAIAKEALHSLYEDWGAKRAWTRTWASDDLGELGALLIEVLVPFEVEPDKGRDDDIVTTEDSLREVRWAVVRALADKSETESKAAIERLSAIEPQVRRWIESIREHASLEQLIAPLAVRGGGSPTPRQVVRMLERGGFFLRDEEDLFHLSKQLLSEEFPNDLRRYGRDVLSQLKDKSHERVLQAIALMWLRVRMGIATVFREPQEQDADRPDVVLAVTGITKRVLVLPIEAKWSDSVKLESGFTEQLGERYVVRENRRFGLYVVGVRGASSRAKVESILAPHRTAFAVAHRGSEIDFVLVPWARAPATANQSRTSTARRRGATQPVAKKAATKKPARKPAKSGAIAKSTSKMKRKEPAKKNG
jgi:hypothetical protein